MGALRFGATHVRAGRDGGTWVVSRGPRRAAVVFATAALASIATSAQAVVFMNRDQALDSVFPRARIVHRSIVLDEAQVAAVQRRAGAKLTSRIAGAWVATRADTLLGVAFFDTRTVRTMPGVFMTVVAPDSTVARVEVLAFHEPRDYMPSRRWLDQFDGRPVDDRLWPRRDIRNLTGATLTSRAVTESVRLSLALYEIVVAPSLAREALR